MGQCNLGGSGTIGFKYTIFGSKDISRSREEDGKSILVGAIVKYGWPLLPLE